MGSQMTFTFGLVESFLAYIKYSTYLFWQSTVNLGNFIQTPY